MVRRRLGGELRRLRELANIRIERAARELECSPARVSRLENGLAIAKVWDVRILLQLYGVDDGSVRDEMERWASQSKAGGWWESDAELSQEDLDRFLSLESEASAARLYAASTLPALLQTEAYATAYIHEQFPDLTTDHVARLVQLRLIRQEALTRSKDPLAVTLVINEAALYCQVGSARVLADQLRALGALLDNLEQDGRDHLDVRVFPYSAGTPSRARSPFGIFEPRLPEFDPVVGFVEQTYGDAWYEAPHDIAELEAIFAALTERSLTPLSSRALIRDLSNAGAPDAGTPPRKG